MNTDALIARVESLENELAAQMDLTTLVVATLLTSGAMSREVFIANLDGAILKMGSKGADKAHLTPFLELRNWLVLSPDSL